MSEALFGITGKDFVLLAADAHASQSIARLKDDVDKIFVVQNYGMAAVGPNGDVNNFVEYVAKNIRLYQLRNSLDLSVKAAVNFTRNELAGALRSGPFQTDMIIGGVDQDGPSLYFIDYLASAEKVNKAAHGYGAYFALSIMDRYWKKDMTLDEAKDIMRKCFQEMETRFLIHMSAWKLKVCTKDGVQEISL
eukprot:TRINITY_DN5473_c0_g1_i1.p1 TRINITY_DN5473_c0_g1~~TRINITY_DN5473_c0_g1_i1.p1  ORF type:complete len:192 (-),score=73.40 TRINITY_DN5473_c0_g1_i1:348-923(-)